MKKIIYAFVIAVSSALVFTACTEEEVTPGLDNGGGTPIVNVEK